MYERRTEKDCRECAGGRLGAKLSDGCFQPVLGSLTARFGKIPERPIAPAQPTVVRRMEVLRVLLEGCPAGNLVPPVCKIRLSVDEHPVCLTAVVFQVLLELLRVIERRGTFVEGEIVTARPCREALVNRGFV